MAKRGRKAGRGAAGPGSVVGNGKAAPKGDVLGSFAEDLGRILGTATSKATAWMDQRRAIADQLTQIRDTANEYLQQLTGGGANMAVAVTRARRGRPPGSGARKSEADAAPAATDAPKKRTMSTEARAKIAAAQKARWAKQKRQGK